MPAPKPGEMPVEVGTVVPESMVAFPLAQPVVVWTWTWVVTVVPPDEVVVEG